MESLESGSPSREGQLQSRGLWSLGSSVGGWSPLPEVGWVQSAGDWTPRG